MSKKQFLLTLLLAVISGFLGGALSVWFLRPPSVLAQDEPPKVIEAQEFRVVDEDGNSRTILGNGRLILTGLKGAAVLQSDSLRIAHLDSESAVEMFADEDGARLRISTETSDALVQIDPEGISTKNNNGLISLTLDKSDGPNLGMWDDTNGAHMKVTPERIDTFSDTGSISLAHDESDGPSLLMKNETNGAYTAVGPEGISTVSDTGSAVLTHNPGGPKMTLLGSSAEFIILDEDRMIALLGVDEDGNPRFQLYDSKGDVRAVLGSTRLKNTSTGSTEIRAPSSLVLFDEEGDVVWSAP